MQSTQLQDLVDATGKLATLPATVVDLLQILSEPMASAADVQKILERDPAMTANVLRISNSAFYGVRREIASVRDALVMLGNRRTATLALATAMVPVMRRDLEGYRITRHQFWNHALVTAAASAEAARHLGCEDLHCEAFTAGLIHDVGMLVLDPLLAELGGLEEGFDTGQEVQILGFDHCQAGALLAEQWGFPDILVAPIAAHHQDPKHLSGEGVIRAVAAGNLLGDAAQLSDDDPGLTTARRHLASLGLPGERVEDLRLDLAAHMGEIGGVTAALAPMRS